MKYIIIALIVIVIYMGVGAFFGWIMSSAHDEKITLWELFKFSLYWPMFLIR